MAHDHGSDSPDKPVLLFDGVCNLCNRSVDFIIRHDRRGIVHFASLQSEAGRDLLKLGGLPENYDASLVLFDEDRYWTESDAALRVTRHLDGVWPWLGAFRIVPLPIRDTVYRWISRNRYRWFGQRETCRLPSPQERSRFLDDGQAPDHAAAAAAETTRLDRS